MSEVDNGGGCARGAEGTQEIPVALRFCCQPKTDQKKSSDQKKKNIYSFSVDHLFVNDLNCFLSYQVVKKELGDELQPRTNISMK